MENLIILLKVIAKMIQIQIPAIVFIVLFYIIVKYDVINVLMGGNRRVKLIKIK